MVLKVERDGNLTELLVQPVLDKKGSYKLGLWVRDDTQGIGTLTYMDENGNYGALGHGISDVDTGTLLNLSGGTLYHTDILSVVKGLKGSPGEMTGVIRYQSSEVLGTTRRTPLREFSVGHKGSEFFSRENWWRQPTSRM